MTSSHNLQRATYAYIYRRCWRFYSTASNSIISFAPFSIDNTIFSWVESPQFVNLQKELIVATTSNLSNHITYQLIWKNVVCWFLSSGAGEAVGALGGLMSSLQRSQLSMKLVHMSATKLKLKWPLQRGGGVGEAATVCRQVIALWLQECKNVFSAIPRWKHVQISVVPVRMSSHWCRLDLWYLLKNKEVMHILSRMTVLWALRGRGGAHSLAFGKRRVTYISQAITTSRAAVSMIGSIIIIWLDYWLY